MNQPATKYETIRSMARWLALIGWMGALTLLIAGFGLWRATGRFYAALPSVPLACAAAFAGMFFAEICTVAADVGDDSAEIRALLGEIAENGRVGPTAQAEPPQSDTISP